jgi:hypothetical protein
MTISRQQFNFATGASAVTDTGGPFTGLIHQVRWQALSGTDTGGELAIFVQQRPEDTGDGFLVWRRSSPASHLTTDFVGMPRRLVVEDTGTSPAGSVLEAVGSAGEHLRVRITPGGTGVAGKLYIWTKSD